MKTKLVNSMLRQFILPTLTFHRIRKSGKMISFSQLLACLWGPNVTSHHSSQLTIPLLVWGGGGSVGLPRWLNGTESACQCRRHSRRDFNPWVRKIPWRRKWQPTLGFLPGKSHGQRGLAGCSPWGCKKSDLTCWLNTHARLFNEQAKSSDWDFWFCKTEMHVLSIN